MQNDDHDQTAPSDSRHSDPTPRPSGPPESGEPCGGSAVTRCLNCGCEMAGRYCPECGQSAATRRLTFSNVTENIASAMISLERGAPRTLAMLILRPGAMIGEFIDGKRVSYVQPFSLLMVLCGIYSILLAFFGMPLHDIADAHVAEVESESVLMAGVIGEIYSLFSGPITSYIVMIPIYALAAKLSFRRISRKKYNFTEYCVVTTYICCMSLIIEVVFKLLLIWLEHSFFLVAGIEYLILAILFYVTYKGLFRLGWWPTAWRILCMMTLSLVMAIAAVFLILLIFLFKSLML